MVGFGTARRGRRRRAAALAAALAVVLVPAGGAYGAGTGGDWPQADHDASANRANTTATQLTAANIGRVRWLRGLGGPPPVEAECGVGFTAPVVVGKRAYAVSTGRLLAYDLTTGALVWQRVLETGHLIYVRSVAAVVGGRVFVASLDCISNSDPSGGVRAFSATTGAPLWSRSVTGLSGVSVSGGRVVAVGSTVGSGSTVEVLDAATGGVVWQRPGDDCFVGAVVALNRVHYGRCDQVTGAVSLVAASVATGAVAWRKPGFWPVQRADGVGSAARHLYSGNVDLNPATGATRFALTGATRVDAVDGTRVYAVCDTVVCAFNRATGARVWTATTPGGLRPAALAGALLYTSTGAVLAAATGAPVAQLWTGDGRVTVGNGYVVAAVDDRVLDVYGLPWT